MTKKKYQVFISSTYTDLMEERMAVTMCLLRNGFIPVGMEQFPASGMEQMEYIKMMLDDCDYYILILAGRYGSIDKSDDIGYTEKEYDYAIKKGIPVLSFVLRNIDNLPYSKCEKSEIKQKKLDNFRAKALDNKMAQMFDDIADLREGVATAMHQIIHTHPQKGWVRCSDNNTVVETEHIDPNIYARFPPPPPRKYPPEDSDFTSIQQSDSQGRRMIEPPKNPAPVPIPVSETTDKMGKGKENRCNVSKELYHDGGRAEDKNHYVLAYLLYLEAYKKSEVDSSVADDFARVLEKMAHEDRKYVLEQFPLPEPILSKCLRVLHARRGKLFVERYLKNK